MPGFCLFGEFHYALSLAESRECPGTYVVTEPVTEQDLLRIANQIARKRLAKGTAITSTTEAAERLQTLLQDREHEVFGALFLTPNTAYWLLRNCFAAP